MQVGMIVDDIFEEEEMIQDDDTISYADKIYKITIHPLVVEFASGTGTARHGTTIQESSHPTLLI